MERVSRCLSVVLLRVARVGLRSLGFSAGETVYAGVLGSTCSLSLLESLVISLTRPKDAGSFSWPLRLGCCRLRVFFRIPPGDLRVVAPVPVVSPLRVAALLGAMISVVWGGVRVWGIVEFIRVGFAVNGRWE